MPSPLVDEAARCVACGLCLPHCPTYRKTGSEADSPRGRIMLMQGVLDGRIAPDDRFFAHIDLCLSCRACESVCPNNVAYGRLIEGVRARFEPVRRRSLVEQTRRGMLGVMIRPAALWLMAVTLRAWQLAGVQALLGRSAWLRRLGPLRLTAGLPQLKALSWRQIYPAHGRVRGEVGLFLGCVARVMDSQTLTATIFVLNRLGYTVHVPAGQVCCGALPASQGDLEQARTFERDNLAAFEGLALEAVISTATGCGAALKDYPPQFAARVRDIGEFLAEAEWGMVEMAPLAGRVAVHEPCSMRNVLHCQDKPYAFLRRIPGIDIVPLAGNDQCCGAAGSYFLTQPEMAGMLLDDKIAAAKTSAARYLVSSNVGCALHLATGMREAGMAIEVLHPVTLLARQMGMNNE